MSRIGSPIRTASGIEFYPLDPRPEEIMLEDIAHALSHQCRWSGHTRVFYSVAEHCVRVSRLCDRADALWGLLHDASEAYLVDVARPVKNSPEMSEYRNAERRLQLAIAHRFRLIPRVIPFSVTVADDIALYIESRDLMGWQYPEASGINLDVYLSAIKRTLPPEAARARFLNRFQKLTKGQHG